MNERNTASVDSVGKFQNFYGSLLAAQGIWMQIVKTLFICFFVAITFFTMSYVLVNYERWLNEKGPDYLPALEDFGR